MSKKTLLIILAAVIIVCAVMTIRNAGIPFVSGRKFSSVELIYENQNEAQGVNDRYYYNRLSDNAKIAYTLIVPEIPKHTPRIEVPRLDDNELDELLYAISYDNPELICCGKECQLVSEMGSVYFVPTYTHTEQQHDAYCRELENAVAGILSKLPAAGDYKKELYIHDAICDRCRYINDTNDNLKVTAYDVLVTGEAVCEGYAKATQLLLNRAGVHNYLVKGNACNKDGELVGHMWNVVSINSQNYYLDVTWDDSDVESSSVDKNYIYFNVDEKMLSKDHFNINPSDNGCDSLYDNYFAKNGNLYHTYDSVALEKIEDGIVENVLAGEYRYEIMFSDHEEYAKMASELLDGEAILDVIERVNSRQSRKRFSSVEYSTYDNIDYVRFVFS